MSETPQLFFTPFSQLAHSHKFASAVIMFGSLLRNSKFVKNSTWNDVMEIAKSSADMNNFSQKEFLELVELAKKLYGKKRKKDD
jgi:Ca-activated chloride channel family protein